jgi:hypothetical protein
LEAESNHESKDSPLQTSKAQALVFSGLSWIRLDGRSNLKKLAGAQSRIRFPFLLYF